MAILIVIGPGVPVVINFGFFYAARQYQLHQRSHKVIYIRQTYQGDKRSPRSRSA